MVYQLDRPSQLLPNLDYSYDKKSQRFRNKTSGRFLSQNQAINILENGLSDRRSKITESIDRYLSGKIEIDRFILQIADSIKDLHVLNAVIAVGGRKDQLSKKQLEVLRTRVKNELTTTKDPFSGDKYGLQVLTRDLLKGNLSEAQLRDRLNKYADSANLTQEFLKCETQKSNGKKEGLRKLGASHKNCTECLAYAGLGWVSIDKLVLPGQACSCRSNCKCSIIYR